MSKEKSLLKSLNLPDDLQNLDCRDLERLASEIRETLMEIGDKCGGHLASNLGVVELTLALHSVFESPKDKLLWDVSHQTYVHKILTGRLSKMFTIKKKGGLSGFAKITESDHDIFGAGHASTALSAALGMAHARDIQNQDHNVIAIIGDASLSGGMSYEAINNIDKMKGNFICILNDNDMSISPPVGAMASYITDLRTSKVYNKAKEQFERIFNGIPKIGVPLRKKIEKTVERMRNTLIDTKVGVFFEEFGFKYLGPLDGHNIPMVMAALKYAKTHPGPIMIHLITKKGKGHEAAEQDPVKYHGISALKAPSSSTITTNKTYTKVFSEEIIKVAKKNKKVTVITPAMREGSGLVEYEKQFPDRYFDVGIAEEHALTFAAGLSRAGLTPVLAIYSTFLQRGFDQLIHDVCIQKLPMVLAIDRAGLVGPDGPTHHGVFDYSYLNLIPEMTILAPKDGGELRKMLSWAVDSQKIVSIRYGKTETSDTPETTPEIEYAKSEVLEDHPDPTGHYDTLLLAAGSLVAPAKASIQDLKADAHMALINLRFIKPLDEETILNYAQKSTSILILEEGNKPGGIHASILQLIAEKAPKIPSGNIHSISIPDEFADHATIPELHDHYALSPTAIKEKITTLIAKKEVRNRLPKNQQNILSRNQKTPQIL